MEPLEAAWLSMVSRHPVEYDRFIEVMKECEVFPIYVNGETAGALIVKDCDIHACVLPQFKGKWLTRKELRIMDSVIEKYGHVQTTATTEEGQYFVTRLGFVRDGDIYRRYTKWA